MAKRLRLGLGWCSQTQLHERPKSKLGISGEQWGECSRWRNKHFEIKTQKEISIIGDGYESFCWCVTVKTNQKTLGSEKWFLVIHDCCHGRFIICFSSLSGTPIVHLLVSMVRSHRSLRFCSFFFFFFFFWLNLYCVFSHYHFVPFPPFPLALITLLSMSKSPFFWRNPSTP